MDIFFERMQSHIQEPLDTCTEIHECGSKMGLSVRSILAALQDSDEIPESIPIFVVRVYRTLNNKRANNRK